ncbi:hypothetical protein HKY33_24370 [Escherichia coli O157:H7]|nr:hypothetical protein [Escherichia coli O157:H7]
MDEQIRALLNQIRILETEANKPGAEKSELFKAAGKLKDQVATLLNQQGIGQQQQPESKIPDPDAYFSAHLPEGFEDNYFSGDFLTDEQRDYFSPLKVKNIENAPDELPSTETPKSYEMDADVKKRILNAIGIPC